MIEPSFITGFNQLWLTVFFTYIAIKLFRMNVFKNACLYMLEI